MPAGCGCAVRARRGRAARHFSATGGRHQTAPDSRAPSGTASAPADAPAAGRAARSHVFAPARPGRIPAHGGLDSTRSFGCRRVLLDAVLEPAATGGSGASALCGHDHAPAALLLLYHAPVDGFHGLGLLRLLGFGEGHAPLGRIEAENGDVGILRPADRVTRTLYNGALAEEVGHFVFHLEQPGWHHVVLAITLIHVWR